jgi:hypothetical protein
MKYEVCKRVNFGIFSNLPRDEVVRSFVAAAKNSLRKKEDRKGRVGSIWALEVNGGGKGAGVIAADDKVYAWKDSQ